VDSGAARMRLVTLGERTGDLVEVLSGIAADEKVVQMPPASLTDGAKVEVLP